MTVQDLLNALLTGDIPRSLQIFAPELVLCVAIIALLLSRLFGIDRKLPATWVALFGALIAFAAVFAQFMYINRAAIPDESLRARLTDLLAGGFHYSADGVGSSGGYFTGLLMHDPFTLFFRLGLSLFVVLVVALTVLTGIPDNEDGPDFYTLLLGATIGMMIATSANHLLILFLGVEMMSVPSYAMVAFLKGRRQSSEAALKYVVYGAGAAGVMLYGVSLLAGLLGSGNLPELAQRFVVIMEGETFGPTSATTVTTVLGIMMILVGLAFKLSLVPFHFWCPDAFEGAPAEVAGYLSVASKAAAFALLVRFLLAFSGTEQVLYDLRVFLAAGLAVIAALSMTLGNLAAYTQTNLKRLLAYSTIAHAGYMLMAVSALMVLVDAPTSNGVNAYEESISSLEGLMYYLAVYLFMNLVAFAVVAMLRNELFSEQIEDYRGLARQGGATTLLCVCMGCAMFSLVGIPPFGGFFAKLQIFMAVFSAGNLHWFLWVLLAIAAANTIFSLFYYVRVLKAMFIEEAPDDAPRLRTPGLIGAYVVLITVPIILLGSTTLMARLTSTAAAVASHLFQ
jgi:NADH-quinone oxidoreductase subunit N